MISITVTSHALVRFLERAVGFDLGPWRDGLAAAGGYGDADLIRAIEHGRCLDVFREAIAIVVRSGVETGAVSVYFAGLTFCLAGACVVTIVEGRANPRRLVSNRRMIAASAERAAA